MSDNNTFVIPVHFSTEVDQLVVTQMEIFGDIAYHISPQKKGVEVYIPGLAEIYLYVYGSIEGVLITVEKIKKRLIEMEYPEELMEFNML